MCALFRQRPLGAGRSAAYATVRSGGVFGDRKLFKLRGVPTRNAQQNFFKEEKKLRLSEKFCCALRVGTPCSFKTFLSPKTRLNPLFYAIYGRAK